MSSRLILIVVFLFLAGMSAWTGAVHADGAESLDDALAALDNALANDDLIAIESLINAEAGITIAGAFIEKDDFTDRVHDRTPRSLSLRSENSIVTRELSFEELLWGEDGVFTRLGDATLTHYAEVDRDELLLEETWTPWEHGEFEVATVSFDDSHIGLFVPPSWADASNVISLLDAVLFIELEGSWYISAIAPHERIRTDETSE